jgi:hypothetical protein
MGKRIIDVSSVVGLVFPTKKIILRLLIEDSDSGGYYCQYCEVGTEIPVDGYLANAFCDICKGKAERKTQEWIEAFEQCLGHPNCTQISSCELNLLALHHARCSGRLKDPPVITKDQMNRDEMFLFDNFGIRIR